MTDGRPTGGEPLEEHVAGALRRVEAEARPRAEFRRDLRDGFADGTLAPRPVRVIRVSRWVAYPLAAAALLLALALSGALGTRARPETPAPMPERLSPEETALVAAERRLASVPALAGRAWRRRLVEQRPWLLPAEAAFADLAEIRTLSLYAAEGDSVLRSQMPSVAARPALPVVTVVAPSRRAFEAIVGPRLAPVPLGAFTIAHALAGEGVLLLSPEALEVGGPPCEEMGVVHEGVHAWLHARRRGTAPLPLWLEEGIAGVVSQGGFDTKEWCRQVLAGARTQGLDPFTAEEILDFRDYGAMARHVAAKAPCEERPFSLVPVFGAHAESLVLFLLEEHPGCVHRAGFLAWLGRVLDGEPATAEGTARALGFPGTAALLAERDRWLGL